MKEPKRRIILFALLLLPLVIALPIVIASKDDIKSEANWRGRFEPYHHQVQNLITFCRRLPVTLLDT